MVSEIWLPWSDTRGWYVLGPCDTQEGCENVCEWLAMTKVNNCRSDDWRPVRIPPPSQIEATADLLAALKLILESVPSEAIGEYESNVAHAAIAKANRKAE